MMTAARRPTGKSVLTLWLITLLVLDVVYILVELVIRDRSLSDALSRSWIYAFNLAMLSGAFFLYFYYRRQEQTDRRKT
jgi:hypothetical protein